jgi:hypothetical protein
MGCAGGLGMPIPGLARSWIGELVCRETSKWIEPKWIISCGQQHEVGEDVEEYAEACRDERVGAMT